jgi:thiamine pyrophosphate-dependent acetolactate synthase large subunit-like protein
MDRERADHYPLRRRAVVEALLADRGDMLVVTGLGAATWDATAAGDHPLTFPLWGAMGGAVMTGLGLCLAQPGRRVLVLTGDGELLMGLGALAAVAAERPANLAVVVLDNERYGETGMQRTHTAHGVDLPAVASGCGFAASRTVVDEAGVGRLARQLHDRRGPLLANVKIATDTVASALPPRDGAYLKGRFREALLGQS